MRQAKSVMTSSMPEPQITLINTPGIKSLSGLQMHDPNPPLGLAYIAGILKAAGYRFSVIDATGEAVDGLRQYPGRPDLVIQGLSPAEIVERVPESVRVIGVSCMFSTLWPLARAIAEGLRQKFPNALLVLGGEHGTAVPDHVLQTSVFDVVILGEGEETFLSLLEAVFAGRSFKELRGIAFRDGDRLVNTGLSQRNRAIDQLPLPDWDSFPIESYIASHQINGVNLGRAMPLLATRGCPYQCTFCSNPNMWTTRYVTRDPKLVADEIELYARKYRVKNVDFQDLTAVVKRPWVVAFCHEMIKRNLGVTWQMPSGTRSEVFDEEVADLLYKAGCRVLAFAPESGSPYILERIKKRVDLAKLVSACKVALRRGFKATSNNGNFRLI